jgi:dihydroxyacetone kinase-like predicted kinase
MAVANQAIDATDFFAVTRATKNATVSGMLVHGGDYMLLVDDKFVGVGQSVEEALVHLSESPLAWDDKSLISVYRGVDFAEASFDALVATLTQQFPDLEIQSYYGGQAFYGVVGSVE